MKSEGRNQSLLRIIRCVVFAAISLWLAHIAAAHNGPPFPIVTDQRVGPCVISLWTHPDIGTGTFWIMVDPPAGGAVPKDLKFQVGIQPVSGRTPEVLFKAWPDSQRGQIEFKSEVQFDQQDFFKVRLILASSAGGGEVLSQVEATPLGFGQWDLFLYALPFLGVGFLVVKGFLKRRKFRKAQLQESA